MVKKGLRLDQIPERVIARFYERFTKSDDGCWTWNGTTKSIGYGYLHIKENRVLKAFLAHRIAYILNYGDIPDGQWVCHTCDNPKCVNPEHLFLGTPYDNWKDAFDKGHLQATYKKLGDANRSTRRLTKSQLVEVLELLDKGVSQSEIARKFGYLSSGPIAMIARGENYIQLVAEIRNKSQSF